MSEERIFERQVDDLAERLRWRRCRQDIVPRKRSVATKGWPDRVYFRDGLVRVLELKPEKGRDTTPEQDDWLAEWAKVAERAAPGQIIVAVARPSDLPQIAQWLR